MPRWINDTGPAKVRNTFRLMRTPPSGYVRGITTSEGLMGCAMHFVGGRSLPHEEDAECRGCLEGRPYRWLFYFAAIIAKINEHVIYEVTAATAKKAELFIEEHGYLRGMEFEATRLGSSGTARVLLRCVPAKLERIVLPDPPDVRDVLEHMWSCNLDRMAKGKNDRGPDEGESGGLAIAR